MILSENDNQKIGFIRRYYAKIDITLHHNSWIWQQIDAHGKNFGNPSNNFATEQEAMDDALAQLDGDDWE